MGFHLLAAFHRLPCPVLPLTAWAAFQWGLLAEVQMHLKNVLHTLSRSGVWHGFPLPVRGIVLPQRVGGLEGRGEQLLAMVHGLPQGTLHLALAVSVTGRTLGSEDGRSVLLCSPTTPPSRHPGACSPVFLEVGSIAGRCRT